MLRHPRVKRPDRFQAEESGERLGGHAAAPKGAVDPIADLSLPLRRPTANVSGYLTVNEHRLFQKRVVGQELRPMLVERSPVARIECDHGHRDRISLVLEKQRQVVRFNIPQLDLWLHRGLEKEEVRIKNYEIEFKIHLRRRK